MEENKEKILKKLQSYSDKNQREVERLESYLTENPKASIKELEREKFSGLLKIAGNNPDILREYIGIYEEIIPIYGTNADTLLVATSQQSAIDKLVNYRNSQADENKFISIIDYLASQHYQGNSLNQIAKKVGINNRTISIIFKKYNLPIQYQADAVRKNWKDEDFRKRQADAVRETWKDENFRKRNTDATRERWKDKNFRKRQADAVSKARKSYIEFNPTYKEDLNRTTSSEVEANIERAIKKSKREYEIKFWHNNSIVINHSTTKPIYFLTETKNGRKVAYAVIPSPNKKTLLKKEKFESEGIRVRFTTDKFYKSLERLLSKRIDNWE